MKNLMILSIAILIGGCSAVVSPVPVGEKPMDLTASRDELEGTWMLPNADDGEMRVEVVDGSNGVLNLTLFDLTVPETNSFPMFMRDAGNWTFVNLECEDDDDSGYLWARIEISDGVAILWGPDVKKFRQLVQDGTLPGSVEKGNVMLGNLTSNHFEIITSEAHGVLFEWDEPMVFVKTGSPTNEAEGLSSAPKPTE